MIDFEQRRIMLADKIRVLRKKKGLSLERLASLVGSSKSYIWELEHNPNANPSGCLLSNLSEALDVTMDYLMSSALELTDEDDTFLRDYYELKPEVKRQLHGILNVLKNKVKS